MNTFENREAAFASQNYDPAKVKMEGVPAHLVEAAIGFINLCVGHEAVDPDYNPDYTDNTPKFEAVHVMGSPSGGGFRFINADYWYSGSGVGARLSARDRKTTNYIAELFHVDHEAMKVKK